ncbi:MAG: DUF4352 domain-containing protein [Nitrolancea sp.]
MRFRLATLPALLSVVVAITMTACGGGTAALQSGVATPGANGHFQVGVAAPIGSYILTVDRVLYPADLNGIKPSDGMKFLILDLTIQTTDSSNDRISAAAQMVVKDGQGTDYPLDADVTPSTDFSTTQLPDTIPALGSIHGEVAYQVPVDATDLRLVFNPSFLQSLLGHGKELTIDLQ